MMEERTALGPELDTKNVTKITRINTVRNEGNVDQIISISLLIFVLAVESVVERQRVPRLE